MDCRLCLPAQRLKRPLHTFGILSNAEKEGEFGGRYAATPISSPNYILLAEAYGLQGRKVDRAEEVMEAIQWAAQTPGCVIVDVAVERTHQPGVGRMTLAVRQSSTLPQISRHLRRLADVLDVTVSDDQAVHREYYMIRVRCSPQQRPEVITILNAFQASPLSLTANHMVVEATGYTPQIDALFAALSTYGIEEAARTSPIAIRTVPPDHIDRQDSTTERQSA